jgi:hypothetical protein
MLTRGAEAGEDRRGGWWQASDGRWYPPEQRPDWPSRPVIRGESVKPPARAPLARRPWILWTLAALAAITLTIAGTAVGSASRQDEIEAAERGLVRAEDDAAAAARSAEQELVAAEEEADQRVADAQSDAMDAAARRQAELDDREVQLDQRQTDLEALGTVADERVAALDQRQVELDARQADLDERQATIEANSFGNGLFEVGVDIQPGTYHTEAPAGCYWAKLGPDGDIIDNDFRASRGSLTVTIGRDAPFFESTDCGTWTRR